MTHMGAHAYRFNAYTNDINKACASDLDYARNECASYIVRLTVFPHSAQALDPTESEPDHRLTSGDNAEDAEWNELSPARPLAPAEMMDRDPATGSATS